MIFQFFFYLLKEPGLIFIDLCYCFILVFSFFHKKDHTIYLQRPVWELGEVGRENHTDILTGLLETFSHLEKIQYCLHVLSNGYSKRTKKQREEVI